MTFLTDTRVREADRAVVLHHIDNERGIDVEIPLSPRLAETIANMLAK